MLIFFAATTWAWGVSANSWGYLDGLTSDGFCLIYFLYEVNALARRHPERKDSLRILIRYYESASCDYVHAYKHICTNDLALSDSQMMETNFTGQH
jgi:hypothetical protein